MIKDKNIPHSYWFQTNFVVKPCPWMINSTVDMNHAMRVICIWHICFWHMCLYIFMHLYHIGGRAPQTFWAFRSSLLWYLEYQLPFLSAGLWKLQGSSNMVSVNQIPYHANLIISARVRVGACPDIDNLHCLGGLSMNRQFICYSTVHQNCVQN